MSGCPIDQFGQVIDMLASERRDWPRPAGFFTAALSHGRRPVEVTTDRAASYPRVLDERLPAAHHVDAQYANNPIEGDQYQHQADSNRGDAASILQNTESAWPRW